MDEGGPNRKFWFEVGATGKVHDLKSFFTHPTDESRKIFIFTNTPYLIKIIGNCLAKCHHKVKLII